MSDDLLCPVCGYPFEGTSDVPLEDSFDICSCCGFEFGFDDGINGDTYESYRDRWIANGCKWWTKRAAPPKGWNPISQLRNIGIG